MIINNSAYLSNKKITEGSLYLAKDGRCLLYIGVSNEGKHIFYHVTSIGLYSIDYSNLGIVNEDLVIPYIKELTDKILSRQINKAFIIELTSLPKLYMDIYKPSHDPKVWISKNKLAGLVSGINIKNTINDIDDKFKTVKAKDLEIGLVYVTGRDALNTKDEGWRSTYIFLGRNDRGFKWLFIGNCSIFKYSLLSTDVMYHIQNYATSRNIFYTKQNKRVYRPIYYKQAAEFKLPKSFINSH